MPPRNFLAFFILSLGLTPVLKAQSLILEPTDFALVKKDLKFEGKNFFDLAIREGLYQRQGKEYLPGDKCGTFPTQKALWHGSNGVGLIRHDRIDRTYAIYNFPSGFKPGNHTRIAYADDDFVFIKTGDFATQGQYGPGLLVYSSRLNRFARILSVATAGGQFGKFSYEELRKYRPNDGGPQITWNYSHLQNLEYADLSKDWFLQNPHSAERDKDQVVLNYFDGWKIDSFIVRLKFKIQDLDKAFDKLDPAPGN